MSDELKDTLEVYKFNNQEIFNFYDRSMKLRFGFVIAGITLIGVLTKTYGTSSIKPLIIVAAAIVFIFSGVNLILAYMVLRKYRRGINELNKKTE